MARGVPDGPRVEGSPVTPTAVSVPSSRSDGVFDDLEDLSRRSSGWLEEGGQVVGVPDTSWRGGKAHDWSRGLEGPPGTERCVGFFYIDLEEPPLAVVGVVLPPLIHHLLQESNPSVELAHHLAV